MKILYIVKTNQGAKWAFNEAKVLRQLGCELAVILPEARGGFADDYRSIGATVYGLVCSFSPNPIKQIQRVKQFRAIVKQENPDLVHTHFVNNTMFVRLAIRHYKIPRLFQVPGPLHMETWYTRRAEVMSANRHDYWGCGCKKTMELYLKAGVKKERLDLTYYGYNEGNADKLYQNNTGILHQEFNLPGSTRIVAMISYFYPPKKLLRQKRSIKGFEDFIDAMKSVLEKHDDVVGMIVGGTFGENEWYVEQIKEYAKQKCGDRIIFTGFRNDLIKIYKEIDIAVHPSHSENLGGAAESLMAGVPTISTNIGGFPDIVLNGVTGLTVPAKQPDEIAAAIETMLASPEEARKMAIEGQKRVCDLLDLEKTGAAVKDWYDRIIDSEK